MEGVLVRVGRWGMQWPGNSREASSEKVLPVWSTGGFACLTLDHVSTTLFTDSWTTPALVKCMLLFLQQFPFFESCTEPRRSIRGCFCNKFFVIRSANILNKIKSTWAFFLFTFICVFVFLKHIVLCQQSIIGQKLRFKLRPYGWILVQFWVDLEFSPTRTAQ